MKDVQGFHRGKCNKCECEEYRSPPPDKDTGRHLKLRCEYCDHTPVDHVKIIELGACTKCGDDNCDKYEPEDPNSYSDCQYCGCDAKYHEGAEKLKKPTAAPQGGMAAPQGGMAAPQGGMAAPQGGMASGGAETSLQVRTDHFGNPVQDPKHGLCKFPGCTFPRRAERGIVHEFCSRTCSRKYESLSYQSGGNSSMHVVGFTGPGSHSFPSTTDPKTAKSSTGNSASPFVKMCSVCKQNPANTGRSWCERCYFMAKSQKH